MLSTGDFQQVISTRKRPIERLRVPLPPGRQGAHQARCISKETIYFSFDQRERNHYGVISGFSWVKNSSLRAGGEDEGY